MSLRVYNVYADTSHYEVGTVMGAKGSSAAVSGLVWGECKECHKIGAVAFSKDRWLCLDCRTPVMHIPAFTLQELEASKELITKLSNQ